ncbi:hypothetical protein ABPG72_002412 [Tetrahymena utriculariae]
MNRQLLAENPTTTFYDANQSVAGIEMRELNNTTNTTYRAGYVNLEDVEDNVYYADNETHKKYQNLQSEDPYNHNDQEKKQNAQLNNQQQGQNLVPKNGQVGLAQNQLANQQQNQQPQQVMNQQSAYPNMPNKNVAGSISFQPQTQQIPLSQNQQLVPQQYQGVSPVYSSQLNNMHNQQQLQQQQKSTYLGMGQMSSSEYQQQLQLQQKIYEDIQRQRINQNQGNRQPTAPSQLSQQVPQNPNQLQSQFPMQRNQPYITQQEMIAKVDVKCLYCYVMQRIPMTSKKFQCFNCQKIQDANPTIPIYSMFCCGKCQARVLYEPGVSDLICCTRCQTINKVSMDTNLLKKQINNQLNKILQNPIIKEQQKNQNEKPKDELSEDQIKQIEKQFSEIGIKKDDQNQRSESFDVSQVQDEQFIELQKKQLEQIELMKQQQQLLQQQIEQKQQAIKQQSTLQSQKQTSPQVQPIISSSPKQSKYPILPQDDKQQNPQAINNQKDLLDLPQQPQQEQQQQITQPGQSLNQPNQQQTMQYQNSNNNSNNNQNQSNQELNSIFIDQSQFQFDQNAQKNNNQQQNNENTNNNQQQQYQQQQLQQQQQQPQQQQIQQQQQLEQQQVEGQQVQRNDRGFSIFEEHQINNCLL